MRSAGGRYRSRSSASGAERTRRRSREHGPTPGGGSGLDDAVRAGVEPSTPPLPTGRHVDLGERGRTFVRQVAGPPGAPTLLLLHGWTASADLNWFPVFEQLGRSFSVVAMDHRGHGRGIRSRRRFRLADCAHDAALLLAHLGTGPAIVVGYSMGGSVAQLLWRDHPGAVSGLVLCATARTFAVSAPEKAGVAALASLAMASRATPGVARRALAGRLIGTRSDHRSFDAWVVGEMHRHDWTSVLEAGNALGRFDSRPWIGGVDVPTAVVATMGDRLVSPARQIAMARSVPGATLHPVQADHSACVTATARFLPVLLDACRSVAARAGAAGQVRQPASARSTSRAASTTAAP